MFSKTIFMQTLKSNWKLWCIFTIILSALGAVNISSYDPATMATVQKMFGGSGTVTMLSFLGNNFYGMMAVLLPVIFIIITSNSLIASKVDRGSMAYLLSTPTKRIQIVGTQAIYLISSLFAMFGTMSLVLTLTAKLTQSGVPYDLHDFLMLNLGAFLVLFATSSISFFASSYFNLSKNAMIIGAGLPVSFFILQILSQSSSSLKNAKYLSLNTMYNTTDILSHTASKFAPEFIALGCIGLFLYTLSIIVFTKKDLPI